ncbi:MAG: TrkH family potassium uptake protein [Bacillota bacterium]
MIKKVKPGQILVGSYGMVGLAGTLLLMLPWASVDPGSTGFLQAWFTATSALTVTGLTVVSTDAHWTLFGKLVILVLMQIGGMGLMVLSTFFLLVLGMRIQLGQRLLAAQDRNHYSFAGILGLVRSVIIITFALEAAGALVMAFLLPELWDDGWLDGLFFVVFHAVSAFNGAGFDLTGQSLEPYRTNAGMNVIVMVLILLGSLGFVVLQEVFANRRWRRLSLHTRLVLWVTGLITLAGSISYFFTEYGDNLKGLAVTGKIVESLFQAVTRTAGFTTVPVGSWNEPFAFLMILMMLIGASPGSVGGGIKTTTFGTIILAVWAIARGRKEVVVFEREIAPDSVFKAFTVTVVAFMLVSVSTLTLMLLENMPMMPVLFEVVSALATVGLSMGITTQLSPFGQVIIIILMFVGRIGVLSLVLLLAGKEYRRVRYIKEDILIG